jgi:hypothetical protein
VVIGEQKQQGAGWEKQTALSGHGEKGRDSRNAARNSATRIQSPRPKKQGSGHAGRVFFYLGCEGTG